MDGTGMSYEQIYYDLWELSCRYGRIAQLRVIGQSCEGRMIPMLELGSGEEAVYCLAGMDGRDRQAPALLADMAKAYCRAWESRWNIEEIYDLRELLDSWKLCFIPVLNPDGYETGEKGSHCTENEIRGLIRIFREYKSRGLLSFVEFPDQPAAFWKDGKKQRIRSAGQTTGSGHFRPAAGGDGSPEQYYTHICRRPAFCINVSCTRKNSASGLRTLPLRYLDSPGSIAFASGFRVSGDCN